MTGPRSAALVGLAATVTVALAVPSPGAQTAVEPRYVGSIAQEPKKTRVIFSVDRRDGANRSVRFQIRDVLLVCDGQTFPTKSFSPMILRFIGPRLFQGE